LYGLNPALKRGAKVKRRSAATLLYVFSHGLTSEWTGFGYPLQPIRIRAQGFSFNRTSNTRGQRFPVTNKRSFFGS
jgi:hypothetical protein